MVEVLTAILAGVPFGHDTIEMYNPKDPDSLKRERNLAQVRALCMNGDRRRDGMTLPCESNG